jgi:hypothetical protein
MDGPHLIRMSDAEFAGLPGKVVPRTLRIEDPSFESPRAAEWILGGYCEKLLYKNEGLQRALQRASGTPDDPECRNCFTRGQRILHALAALDGQVRNGGITQFFWNCPDLIFDVSEALDALGEGSLAQAYDKALENLIGNKDEWMELRRQSGTDPSSFWEPFQKSYDLLDLSWFDEAYFGTYGPSLVARLVNYVRANKAEFIEP